jgi:dTDP-4-amino-4,6-dideoxygalactose transaminase
MKIQMVDLKGQYEAIKGEIDKAIQEVIDDGRFINGPAVHSFSSALAQWNESKYVIPCANGTDGLQIALMALGLKPGDEVIVPAFTYIATVEVLVLLGLKPLFVDVDEATFEMNLMDASSLITPRTKAIMPVHLYGQCSDMSRVLDFAHKHELDIIEDIAQAIGATFKGKKAGNFGDLGVTSFFPSKNLGCYGDGGAVFCNDEKLALNVKQVANHGQSEKYIHDIIGVNSRLDSIQAGILSAKLVHLDQYILARITAANHYDSALKNLDWLITPAKTLDATHVYHQYTLRIKHGKRDELKRYLQDCGIPSMIYYPMAIPDQKPYRQFSTQDYPVAQRLTKEVISLPMHTELNDEQLNYITEKIIDFG